MQNSPARAVDVGTVIAGTYTIEAMIGAGGMGAVFLASHARLPGKKVAIKILHAEIAGEEALARFKREAQIASMLGHPNIVGVENFDVMPDGTPFLVLEYLQGETLAHRLRAGPLALEPALSIVRQVGSALQAAHRADIVHRDLKPQNVFLVPTEFDGRVVEVAKVLDFGISKMRGSQTVKTQDTALLGTPQYMAPEQATGQHSAVDARTDIFAFGAMIYEMLSGVLAFEGASIPEVVFKVVYEQPVPLAERVRDVPPGIAAAVHRALSKKQADRFDSVNDLVEALTGQSLPIVRASSTPPLDPSSPSSPKRSTGRDAFAETMGSGDHGGTASPARPAVAATSASATVTPASENAPPPVAPTAAPPARRSRAGLAAGIAIGCAALAAGGVYLAMRHGDHGRRDRDRAHEHAGAEPVRVLHDEPPVPQPPPVPDLHETPPVHEASPAPVHEVQPVHEAPPAHETPPAHAHEPPPEHAKPPVHEPPPVGHEPGKHPGEPGEPAKDDGAKEKLATAELALKAREFAKARRFANSALDLGTITPGHANQAHAILGIIACVDRNDDETAIIQLNQIRAAPRVRRRVIEECHKVGRLEGRR